MMHNAQLFMGNGSLVLIIWDLIFIAWRFVLLLTQHPNRTSFGRFDKAIDEI